MTNPPTPPEGDSRAKYSAEIVEKICEAIRRDGVSDSSAGLLADVTAQTVSQWKRRQPGFLEKLQRARAGFRRARLECIRQACSREGSPDCRAQVWLAGNAGPGSGASEEEAQDEKVEGAE